MRRHDVLIAGGGPAGCAAALSLRALAPTLDVVVADAGSPCHAHLGETLPPQAAVFLDHLGLPRRLVDDGHVRTYRTLSAWGMAQPIANEFLYGVRQCGWRLNRVRFNTMLADVAQARGVGWLPAHVHAATYRDGAWQLRLADGDHCTARFLIDASGRNAHLCRQLGIAPRRLDRLIACVVHFPPAPEPIDLTLETVADGWWYATDLPDGGRVLACLSDSDIVRQRRLGKIDGWQRGLDATRIMRRLVDAATPLGPPQPFAACSLVRTLPQGLPFLAVGDAASAFDPLSSQGIAKALRSGIFAAYAAADLLLRDDAHGLARYHRFVADEFAAYRRTLGDYYRRERRWASHAFWQRRHAIGNGIDPYPEPAVHP